MQISVNPQQNKFVMNRSKGDANSRYRVGRPCFGFFLQGAVKSLAITEVVRTQPYRVGKSLGLY